MHLQKWCTLWIWCLIAFHGSVGLHIMNVNSAVPQPEECDVHNLKICRRQYWFVLLLDALHMNGAGGMSLSPTYLASGRIIPGMIHLMMFSVAALHEVRLAVCMWLCTGRKWFTSCRLFSVSKMSSLYKSQSRLHEQVWWRNEFCKGSPGEWYVGKFVPSKTIVLHRYKLMCILYTDELLSIQWWWKIVWLHLEGRLSALWTQKIQWCAWRICLGCRMPQSPPRDVGLYALGLDACLYRGKLKWNEA